MLGPQLNLVRKVGKTRKDNTSQEAGAYLHALDQAATNLIRARYEYEGDDEPFLKPQIDSFQHMSRRGGFTTTTQRSVLTGAREVYFNVPPIQEDFRMGEGAEGSEFSEEHPEESQISPINPSPTQDTLDLAPSVSGSPWHRIPKRPSSGNHYALDSDDDDEELTSRSRAVLPISSSRTVLPNSSSRADLTSSSQAPREPAVTQSASHTRLSKKRDVV